MEILKGDRPVIIDLVVAVVAAGLAEILFGDFLYDSQVAQLTPIARVLLIVGASAS